MEYLYAFIAGTAPVAAAGVFVLVVLVCWDRLNG
jgi:hypothetical protein